MKIILCGMDVFLSRTAAVTAGQTGRRGRAKYSSLINLPMMLGLMVPVPCYQLPGTSVTFIALPGHRDSLFTLLCEKVKDRRGVTLHSSL